MSASVLRSVMCGECLGLGCLGNKGEEGTPEAPACSGNVRTISITGTDNITFFDSFLYCREDGNLKFYVAKFSLPNVSLIVSLSSIKKKFFFCHYFYIFMKRWDSDKDRQHTRELH